MASILVVDDEKKITVLLEGELADAGHEVTTAADGDAAIELLHAKRFDAVLTDLRMGGADGLEVLRKAKEFEPQTVVILMTAFASVKTAVEAMKEGAADYLEKPINFERMHHVLERALETRRLADENRVLRERVGSADVGAETMVRGRSPAMARVLKLVEKVAPSEATVLLTGESGTGKEVIARATHDLSARAAGSLVTVNCAALSETLLESELFGHEKGAFTDASERKLGWFEVAKTGTIFLDEIGEMSPSTQAKLLRVLEDHRFHRLGGSQVLDADVRVIAATHRDLEQAIDDGDFREDLFYRLNVFPIHLPPLRERLEDLDDFCAHFLQRGRYRGPGLDAAARAALATYHWPGNLRELRNVIERAVILAGDAALTVEEIHLPKRRRNAPAGADAPGAGDASLQGEASLAAQETRMIREALASAGGNKSKAARILGITRRALYGRLEKYGIADGEEN